MIVVLGGSGQLGTAFREVFPNARFPTRNEIDLANTASLGKMIAVLRPTAIINCAAYTQVDAAESDRAMTTLINATAVGELAQIADGMGVPFATFSSDYVFDGTSTEPYVESSQPNPINVYGETKAAGEQLALHYPGSLVVRTSWLLSATHPNFVSTILDSAAVDRVQVVDDQYGRPVIAAELAVATNRVLENETTGVVHLASGPTTTWFALAQAACEAAGIDPQRVTPCATDEQLRQARRPRRSVLGSERHDELGSNRLAPWTGQFPRLVRQIARGRVADR